MEKITVKPGKGEDMQEKIISEMDKYKKKGFVITCIGYNWFMVKKPDK